MKIVQVNEVYLKGDGISNTMAMTQIANQHLNYKNDVAVGLFSERPNAFELAIKDFRNVNPLMALKGFLGVEGKAYYLNLYWNAMRHYVRGQARRNMEEADVRIWHYGNKYPLFSYINNRDIVYFHNITYPYFSEDPKPLVEAREHLAAFRDMDLHFLTQSEFNRETLVRMGFREEQIHRTYPYSNGDFLYWPRGDAKRKLGLVTYGRYARHKGLVELSKFCYEAGIHLMIFGDNYTAKEYRKEYLGASQYLGEYINVNGKIEDMDEALFRSDVYVSNSYHEGASLTAVEAMAHSLPILARRGTAVDELIDEGKNGFLFDNLDEIPALLDKIGDNYSRMSEAAYRKSRKYSRDNYIRTYAIALKEIRGKGR